MSEVLRRVGTVNVVAVLGGFVLVLPLMVLERSTASDLPRSTFAFWWFVYLWILAALFVGGTIRAVQLMQARQVAALRSISMSVRVAFLGVLAWAWVSMVVDQMPCFLGATGC